MSFKKTLLVFGLTGVLAGASSPKPYASANNLEHLISQEAAQQQKQVVDEQKYADLKKMIDEANSVIISKVKATGFEFNNAYNNICTTYLFEENIPYKLNNSLMKAAVRQSKTVIKSNLTNEPLDIRVAYNGVLPESNIPEDVLGAAKANNVTLAPDAKTPVLDQGKEYIVFLKNLKPFKGNSKLGLIGYLPATDDNKTTVELIVAEYKK
jgi:hypothetical protein